MINAADELFYYYADYKQASKTYETLIKSYPNNANLQMKLGVCYLNIDGKAKESLELLKQASKNIVARENDFDDFGSKAPLDTYIYLGSAYLANDSIEKAIEMLTESKRILANTDLFREDFIDNQLANCRYALQMRENPVKVRQILYTPWMSDYPGACSPVFSSDNTMFVFTQEFDEANKIFLSKYKNGEWERPVEISQYFGKTYRLYTNSITSDGSYLVLSMDNQGDGNLYYSKRKGDRWTKIKNMGKNINTPYYEAFGYVTPNGNTLYFSSNRRDGYGDLDIWISEKDEKGKWGEARNIGSGINTDYDEDAPYYDQWSSTLYFSTIGRVGMGGYDIYKSKYTNGRWSTPENIPYEFNTAASNFLFIPQKENEYVASLYNEDNKASYIYLLTTAPEEIVAEEPVKEEPVVVEEKKAEPKKVEFPITVSGMISFSDGSEFSPSSGTLTLNDSRTTRNIPVDKDGRFSFDLNPGDYLVSVNYKGYQEEFYNLTIGPDFQEQQIAINPALVPWYISDYDYISFNNITFDFDSYYLSTNAKTELDKLKSLLLEYPDMKIELCGFTDAVGTTEYNMELSKKRVQAAIDYLTADGRIKSSRIIPLAYGKTNFVAQNNNSDGSDNPEGRSYNRRIVIGIIEPHSNATLYVEPYTPENLAERTQAKFNVILLKSKDPIPDSYFNSLDISSKISLKPLSNNNVNIYSVGTFFSRKEATSYLNYVKRLGFNDAFICNQYGLIQELTSVARVTSDKVIPQGQKRYTIQMAATKQTVDERLFENFKDKLWSVKGEDGYRRYVYGEFDTVAEARAYLTMIRNGGFPDAFIKETIELY
ncbi:MAG: OmpA family protein [Bacteroidales bacterium]|nr:OmpA family protein [Bacteroidales bacterium]